MTNQRNSALTSKSGTAGGVRENMSGPNEHEATEENLNQARLETRGEFVEDQQRDRDSNGDPGGVNDSIARRKGNTEGDDRLGISRGD